MTLSSASPGTLFHRPLGLLALLTALLSACGVGDEPGSSSVHSMPSQFSVALVREIDAVTAAMETETPAKRAQALSPTSVGSRTDLLWNNSSVGQTVSWTMAGTSVTGSNLLLQAPNWKVVHSADLNGDGQQDLIWFNSGTNQFAAWLMQGSQILKNSILLQGPNWQITHTADFNGDGNVDLLFYNAALSQTVLWLMDGTTGLSSHVIGTSPIWQVSHVVDLNGDSKADLIWRNNQTGQTAAWLMNGSIVIGSSTLLDQAAWRITHVGDLNGDGRDDLVWTNNSTGQTVAWLMNGLSASSSTLLFTHSSWRVSHLADLDGDGKTDMVWRNATNGEVSAWLMNGDSIKAHATLLPGSTGWLLDRVVDLNGDGNQDLIWRHPVNGQSAAWAMNGLRPTAQTTLSVPPGWEVVGQRITFERTAAPVAPTLKLFGTWQGLEGTRFDLVYEGSEVAIISRVSIGNSVCTYAVNRSTTGVRLFECQAPMVQSGASSDVFYASVEFTNGARSQSGPFYISSRSRWLEVNGEEYFPGLLSYIIPQGQGTILTLQEPGTISGNNADVSPASYFNALQVFGPTAGATGLLCPYTGSGRSYQCPALPSGAYTVRIMREGGTLRVSGAEFIVSIVAGPDIPTPQPTK